MQNCYQLGSPEVVAIREENVMKKISVIGATLVAAAVLCAAPISLHQSQDKGLTLSVDKARAVIGRPLTPGSIAGVHRRHERRAYRRGYYGGGYGYYGHAYRPYGYYGHVYRPYGYYGYRYRPYGYYGGYRRYGYYGGYRRPYRGYWAGRAYRRWR